MNKVIENSVIFAVTVLLTAFPSGIFAQKTDGPAPRVSPVPAGRPAPMPPLAPRSYAWSSRGDTSERSIKVDPGVNLEFGCVLEGEIKVNGWRRNEVRVLIVGGGRFTFRTAQTNVKTGAPVWIKVIGAGTQRRSGMESECLSGGRIEVDAPSSSSIRVRGREISTSVDSVKKVDVRSIGGDITMRNISNGVGASAGRGDITVESSTGPMTLTTTEGNILVFDGGPSEIGDSFKANTNSGSISLQSLEYRQINVDSISGSVAYNGNILSGGSYNLRTSKGSIRVTLPSKSGFRLWATYGYGRFSSDIPVDIITETFAGPLKSFHGKAGAGDATLKLSTSNGSIAISSPDPRLY